MRKILTLLIASWIALVPFATQAGMVSSNSIVDDKFSVVFENQQLMTQLQSMGVSESQLQARLSTMTTEEQAMFFEQMENLPAGQDVLSMAFLIFLVFIVTDIIGATDVFPFVNKI